MRAEITQEGLKQLLNYNPDTGHFTWKVRLCRSVKVSSVAGFLTDKGYIRVGIKGRCYYAHRLAFMYITGHTPKEVDHVNHDRTDNRWINLREVTSSENSRNMVLSAGNTSGFVGISFYKPTGKWRASININGKQASLGYYEELSDAVIARTEAEIKHGYHKNHGGKETK